MNKKNILLYTIILLVTLTQSLFCSNPRISIITSVYKGDEFIEGFLADITRQTAFEQCELIMINANSPGNEEPTIKKYLEQYPNIVYIKLEQDPGLYAVWNMAIEMSRGEYITNANLDDRLAPQCYEAHMAALDANPDIMLVYSNRCYTRVANETFEQNSGGRYNPAPEFSRANMMYCLPSNAPMWRKEMHAKYGYFDTSYTYSGDWEMWLRAVEGGAKFKKIDEYYSLYYVNPKGLSTDKETLSAREIEDSKIIEHYGHIWGRETYRELYRTARTLEKTSRDQKTWSLALHLYLKAYSLDPRHAEPLIRIAKHYYETAYDNALTYLFINRACEIPCPQDIQEEDKELYTYVRWDLLGIVAWYVGQFDKGENAIRNALIFKPDDEHLKNNLRFYLDRKK